DGRPDLLMVDLEGHPLLLHNESPPTHWLGVRLIGRHSNRDGIGARVVLAVGGHRQVREVQSGRSYLSACDTRLLFGLGPAAALPSLTVHWPDGRVQQVTVSALDRYL